MMDEQKRDRVPLLDPVNRVIRTRAPIRIIKSFFLNFWIDGIRPDKSKAIVAAAMDKCGGVEKGRVSRVNAPRLQLFAKIK